MIISDSVLRMRNVSDKSLRENQNTHFIFNNFFLSKIVLYEIMRKNMVEPYVTHDNMAHAHCMLDN